MRWHPQAELKKTKTPSELVRLNHVARFIVNANHGEMAESVSLCGRMTN